MKIFRMILTVAVMTALLISGCAANPSGDRDNQTGTVEQLATDMHDNSETTIVFSDVGWDSIRFHNAVARYLVEQAFGYRTDEISGTTPINYPALKKGDIDVLMEMWTDNVPTYDEDIRNKEILEVSTNFDDDQQGLYVPRYVIEGDPARGIQATAPDLKTVKDLLKYPHVFTDPEEPGKGRIYGAISGWNIDQVLYKKYIHLGLDESFTYFAPGSDAAIAAAFTTAYEKGEPVVGYYWEPTWLTGKYDLVRLNDEPYDPNTFNEGIGDIPSVRVTICVNKDLPQKAPEVVELLQKYRTSSALTAEALAYLFEHQATYEETAIWFLIQHDAVWESWLSEDQAARVKAALQE